MMSRSFLKNLLLFLVPVKVVMFHILMKVEQELITIWAVKNHRYLLQKI